MKLGHMNIIQTNSSVILEGTSSNSLIYGLANASFIKFKGFHNNLLEFELKATELFFNGTYKMKARFLGLTLNGDGDYNIFYSTEMCQFT